MNGGRGGGRGGRQRSDGGGHSRPSHQQGAADPWHPGEEADKNIQQRCLRDVFRDRKRDPRQNRRDRQLEKNDGRADEKDNKSVHAPTLPQHGPGEKLFIKPEAHLCFSIAGEPPAPRPEKIRTRIAWPRDGICFK